MSIRSLERPLETLPDTTPEPATDELPVASTGTKKRACCVCGATQQLDVCSMCHRFVCQQHTRRVPVACWNRVTLCPVDYLKEYGELSE